MFYNSALILRIRCSGNAWWSQDSPYPRKSLLNLFTWECVLGSRCLANYVTLWLTRWFIPAYSFLRKRVSTRRSLVIAVFSYFTIPAFGHHFTLSIVKSVPDVFQPFRWAPKQNCDYVYNISKQFDHNLEFYGEKLPKWNCLCGTSRQ
jgi:hypothetical protein